MNTIKNMESSFFNLRLKLLIRLLIGWIIIDLAAVLIFNDFAYEFKAAKEYYPSDLILQSFFYLPNVLQTLIENNPYLITMACLTMSIYIFLNTESIIAIGTLVLIYNFHYTTAYILTSGATTLAANSLSFIFLIVLFKRYEEDNIYSLVTRKHIFIGLKIQLSLIYFISWFSKIISPLWRSGAATYYIFNNERYSHLPFLLPYFNKYDFVIQFSTIVGLTFLAVFPFAIWTKRNLYFIIFSLIFHGFIAVYMGLYEFLIFPLIDFAVFADNRYIVLANDIINIKYLTKFKRLKYAQ